MQRFHLLVEGLVELKVRGLPVSLRALRAPTPRLPPAHTPTAPRAHPPRPPPHTKHTHTQLAYPNKAAESSVVTSGTTFDLVSKLAIR